MWTRLAGFILRNKVIILLAILAGTVFFAYYSTTVRMQYGLPQMLPDDDEAIVKYEEFRKTFGEETIVIVVGIEENPFNNLELYKDWYSLSYDLKSIEGVDTLLSSAHVYNLSKNSKEKKFDFKKLNTNPPKTQAGLDSLKEVISSIRFYEGILFTENSDATLIAIQLSKEWFNSSNRSILIDAILDRCNQFENSTGMTLHYSGLPFIRTIMTRMVKGELGMFVILAALVTLLILYIFFRSLKPVLFSMTVVALGVVWTLGLMGLLQYEITILTSIIPPLLIVIGVPNCIFLINKYHAEIRTHQNKAKALTRVIQKIGNATFLTNATTATGFLTFIFTQSTVLVEFGIIASAGIMFLFIFSLIIIPIFYSYSDNPKTKHTDHLDQKWLQGIVKKLINIILYHRSKVYLITALIVGIALFGITKVKTTGNIVDDLPMDHKVTKDLHFFENNFNGVMPLDIAIDTKNKKGALQTKTLRNIEKLENELRTYSEFSKPVSLVGGIKYAKQAFYGGNPKKYTLISTREKAFFKPYIENAKGDRDILSSFVDSSFQKTRVRVNVADIGTIEMEKLMDGLKPKVDSILPPEDYNVSLTGSSVIYLKGTKYLVNNLFISLLIAIVIVGLIMALLFSSFRMIILSIITNIIPLILTAALMGYFNIHLKPSTILVFSVAFGISVDDTIHYLAKFRQELKIYNWNIGISVIEALRETGVSMLYTSIILFFGFSVFDLSEFGGTMALGILVSFTLFTAMLANLVLLPSFLLTLEKRITTKAFSEPLLDVYDEEDDIDLDDLIVKK